MNTMISFAVLCGMFATSAGAYAAIDPLDAEGSRPALQIIELAPLSFGTFTVERGGGSVRVDAASGACQPQSAVMVRNFCARAQVEIRGLPDTELLVELLPEGVAGNGADLKSLQFYPNQNGIVKLGADGRAIVYIGGELALHGDYINNINAHYMMHVSYLY